MTDHATAVHKSVSLVVTTRERPADLRRCLDAIHRLTRPPAEVVVVNNGSDAATTAVLDDYPTVREIVETAPHLPQIFNRAWQSVNTPLVGYFADDAEPEPQWLDTAIQTMESDAEVGVVTGPIISTIWPAGEMHRLYLAAQKSPPGRWLAHGYNKIVMDGQLMEPGYLAESCAYSLGASLAKSRDIPGPIDIDLATTTSMLVRRSAINDVGGFRLRYCFNHADGDLFIRLKQRGFRIVFDPRVVAHHHVRPGPSRSPYFVGRDSMIFLMDHCRPRSLRGRAGAALNIGMLAAYWLYQMVSRRSIRPLAGLRGMAAGFRDGLLLIGGENEGTQTD